MAEGLRFERRTFHGLFATQDQKEGELFGLTLHVYDLKQNMTIGMAAFAEKRPEKFSNN